MGGVSIYVNGKDSTKQVSVYSLADTSQERTLGRYQQIESLLSKELPPLSYQPGMIWLRLDIPAGFGAGIDFLRIDNPHINLLNVWILDKGQVVASYPQTGDHIPFLRRQIPHPHFVFRLAQQIQQKQLLILVDKQFEPLSLSVHLESRKRLFWFTLTDSLVVAALVGIGVFTLLLTLILFFRTREALYVYYTGYVLLFTLYIICDTGFGAMFLYPGAAGFNDLSRPLLITIAPLFYALFARNILQLPERFPRWSRNVNGFILLYAAIYLFVMLVTPKTGANRVWQLHTMQAMIAAAFVLVLVVSFRGIRKSVPYAPHIFAASLIFLVASQIYIAYLGSYLPDLLVFRHSSTLGFVFHVILLTLVVSMRFSDYKKEALLLNRQLHQQEEEIFRSISNLREEQMRHISGQLHNNIGAGLSSIQYNLEAYLHQGRRPLLVQTIDDLTALTDEVRNIAHSLSPIALQQKGLLQSLRELIASYNRSGRIRIVLENIGSLQAAPYQAEILLYQIMGEVIQNTLRHAEATEMLIQLILEPDLASVYAEDNGKGFIVAETKSGIGLDHIRKLVSLVKGRFDIRTAPGSGTSVSIEFPLYPQKDSL